MIEHLGNCHGEWALLIAAITGLPFLRMLFKRKPKCVCGHEGDGHHV